MLSIVVMTNEICFQFDELILLITFALISTLHRLRSGAWEAVNGLPADVKVKKVTNAVEKDSVLSLLSSGEVNPQQCAFLYNKVCF